MPMFMHAFKKTVRVYVCWCCCLQVNPAISAMSACFCYLCRRGIVAENCLATLLERILWFTAAVYHVIGKSCHQRGFTAWLFLILALNREKAAGFHGHLTRERWDNNARLWRFCQFYCLLYVLLFQIMSVRRSKSEWNQKYFFYQFTFCVNIVYDYIMQMV